jgi:hypothetical protein
LSGLWKLFGNGHSQGFLFVGPGRRAIWAFREIKEVMAYSEKLLSTEQLVGESGTEKE